MSLTSRGFIKVDIYALQLQVAVSIVAPGRVDAMLVCAWKYFKGLQEAATNKHVPNDGSLTANDLPEFCSNLVAALQEILSCEPTNLKKNFKRWRRRPAAKAQNRTWPA